MEVNGYEIKPGANLRYADLSYADLRDTNLQGADLRRADLSYVNLQGTNLVGANLYDAILREVKLNWQSHDLIAEILRQNAGDSPDRRMLAGWVLMSRDKCWDYWRGVEHPVKKAERATRKLERKVYKALDVQIGHGGIGSGKLRELLNQFQALQDLRNSLDEIWRGTKRGELNRSRIYKGQ